MGPTTASDTTEEIAGLPWTTSVAAEVPALSELITARPSMELVGVSETTLGPAIGSANADDGSFNAILGGVIGVVLLAMLCLGAMLLCYKFKNKGTYRTYEAKGSESTQSADAALQEAEDEGKREYFV